jgi:hypothetical protein
MSEILEQAGYEKKQIRMHRGMKEVNKEQSRNGKAYSSVKDIQLKCASPLREQKKKKEREKVALENLYAPHRLYLCHIPTTPWRHVSRRTRSVSPAL